MNNEYGMKEFKELLEKALKKTSDPQQAPFGLSYGECILWNDAQQSAYLWVLEMFPNEKSS